MRFRGLGGLVRLHGAAWLAVAACTPPAPSAPPGAATTVELLAVPEAAPTGLSEVDEGQERSGPLTFDDELLERAVRRAISKLDGEILPPDVEQLSELDVDDLAVRRLGGVERLSGLKSLALNCTPVSDLGPLAGLTRLQELVLPSTPVNGLAPLAGLSELMWVDLRTTQVSDLGPLVGLTRLRYLDLKGAPIDCTKQGAAIQAFKSPGVPCTFHGQCTDQDGSCVATSDQDCRAAEICQKEGRCAARDGECSAESEAECRAAVACRKAGRCTLQVENASPPKVTVALLKTARSRASARPRTAGA